MNGTQAPTQAILISGASSGIGRYLSTHLAAKGYLVYAGARKESDLESLGQLENVVAIPLDVTLPDQLQEAFGLIDGAGTGLYGLINNAGIGETGLLNTWLDSEMFNIFNINVFGPHRLTNTFLPLLLESKGRIVNIGSMSGMYTSKYFGPYSMTKHAMEAYTVALSEELKPYGVQTSIVQPGTIKSEISSSSHSGSIRRFLRAQPPFKEEAQQLISAYEKSKKEADVDSGTADPLPSPEIVAEAVDHALFSGEPKLRYLIGARHEIDIVIDTLIKKLMDVTDNPLTNHKRAELHALLDKHIAQRT